MDIQIRRQGDLFEIVPLTIKGKHWIVDNVNLKGKIRYYIPADVKNELVETLTREGLEVDDK